MTTAGRPGRGEGPRLLVVTTVARTLEAFLLPHARHLRARGWRVEALASGAPASAACRGAFDAVHDIGWRRDPLAPRNLAGALRRVREVVARARPDIVHVHTPVAAFVTRLALRRRPGGRPALVYTAHGFHFYRGGPRLRSAAVRRLERLAGRWTDRLVVINREDEAAARRHRIVPPARLRVMPGIGVDLDAPPPSEAEVAAVRRELRLAEGLPLFTVAAELIPRKRHQDAIAALARLRRHHPACLALAGDGPRRAALARLARRLGVAADVRFLGQRGDVPALMRASAAVLLPSAQEGLSRSVMEAQALGVPVIGTTARGVADLLAGGAGLVVPVGDPEILAGAMAWVLDHPEAAAAMAARARRRVAACALPRVLAMHEALYAEVLHDG